MGKEERNTYTIQEEEIGQVQIADEVVAIIAGLAAMEVDGVSSMAGTSTRDLISKEESLKGSQGRCSGRRSDSILITEFTVWKEYYGSIFQGTGKSQDSN